jgi:cyclopropane fatty-acyl-phospholipid synthase-like methyltransferase
MTFDARAYWQANGPYLAGPGAETPEHELQERRLAAYLPRLHGIDTVLEVGCGRGRIAAALADILPGVRYTGLDVGLAQVEATSLVRPDGDIIWSAIQDYQPGDRRWDLVLTSEALMHIPPEDIAATIDKLLAMARRWLVIVEWVATAAEWATPVAGWNWPHDYLTYLGHVDYAERIGRQVLYAVRR